MVLTVTKVRVVSVVSVVRKVKPVFKANEVTTVTLPTRLQSTMVLQVETRLHGLSH